MIQHNSEIAIYIFLLSTGAQLLILSLSVLVTHPISLRSAKMVGLNSGAFQVNPTSTDTQNSTIYEYNCSVSNVTTTTPEAGYFASRARPVCIQMQPDAERNGGGFSKPSSPTFLKALLGSKLNLFNSHFHEVLCVTILGMPANWFSLKS